MTGIDFDSAATLKSAQRLDAMADNLEEGLRNNKDALDVLPAGTDEVSVRAAGSFNEVAASFVTAMSDGVLELRKLAAVLRTQTHGLNKAEDDSAAALGPRV
ncbi:PE family protein [Antrihabitans sp. YC3-6]|uniref:PE family protein n=1 Tax=Antrihabitans stalagmiti TaxID=2799499 RepID=A0A934NNV1_9NOCA|nr:PE family protein [Antrihabitans stalagmiti]MBJ8338585.1 PE family protein [Antrihabitans stalagmiti]